MSVEAFVQPEWLDVSRETIDRLNTFCALVKKWNPVINLVSKPDISNLWDRHILDSAQIFYQIPPEATTLCDLGSGGGFPGIVLAIIAAESRPQLSISLVESDRRKSVFLSEATRLLGLNVTILTQRVDDLPPQNADVISARALASLTVLCGFALRHMNPSGMALFPKGRAADQEITDAGLSYHFKLTKIQSVMDTEACILCLKDIHHV